MNLNHNEHRDLLRHHRGYRRVPAKMNTRKYRRTIPSRRQVKKRYRRIPDRKLYLDMEHTAEEKNQEQNARFRQEFTKQLKMYQTGYNFRNHLNDIENDEIKQIHDVY